MPVGGDACCATDATGGWGGPELPFSFGRALHPCAAGPQPRGSTTAGTQVTKEQREVAKRVVYGIIYGRWATVVHWLRRSIAACRTHMLPPRVCPLLARAGLTPFGLQAQLQAYGIDISKATSLIASFHAHFQGVKQYMDR